MEIIFPPLSKIINESFKPIFYNQDRYLICWGGRGSSKSVFAAKKLIYRCLSEDYFRFILIRNVYEDIKDSSYQTIKDCIIEMGLESLFRFTVSPLQINCVNGNKFIARGCDKTTKLKSIKDPTGAWYEEDIPSENDFITITTSIRTTKAKYLQEIFTINPEVDGNYEDHWFFKKFFEDKYPHSLNFRDVAVIEIPGGEKVELSYTSHHSTYSDNRWLGLEFKAFLESMKKSNPYYYTIYCLGHWGNRIVGGQFYKCFQRAKHIIDITKIPGFFTLNGNDRFAYNKDLPLHISFDFNVNPYMTCTIWQLSNKIAYQVGEICLRTPRNTSLAACAELERLFSEHEAGMLVYGDPQGLKESTDTQTTVRIKEKDYSEFTSILAALKKFNPTSRISRVYPPVKPRGQFMNNIFEFNYEGIEIFIHDKCTNSINDYLYLLEASDGTKHKQKIKNEDTGVQEEKLGHCSDASDYLLCYAFNEEFLKHLRGGLEYHSPVIGTTRNGKRW